MITSPVTDYLIRLKNGSLAGRENITVPSSKFCLAVSQLLKKYGYISDYRVEGDVKKTIFVTLAYDQKVPRLTEVRIFSKPGRRYYQKSSSLPWGKSKKSLIIISTSSGVISQKEAQAKKLGGEIIAEVC